MGYEGYALVFCQESTFIKSTILFQPETKEEASYLFKSINQELQLKFGKADNLLSQKYAESYYMTFLLAGSSGVVGTHAAEL
ncbi:hypothetical protein MAH1_31900 [Sessilibacter sp. MAH1]